jgi:hypothetical protein
VAHVQVQLDSHGTLWYDLHAVDVASSVLDLGAGGGTNQRTFLPLSHLAFFHSYL